MSVKTVKTSLTKTSVTKTSLTARVVAAAATALLTVGLAACGGSSGSTAAGGGGGSDALTGSLQMPKFEWVQPTLEFLSPTFTEFLLFFVTLILFIASWRDLRRAMIMTFSDRDARLRTLTIGAPAGKYRASSPSTPRVACEGTASSTIEAPRSTRSASREARTRSGSATPGR